jgi:hypothetical protein
MLLVFGQVQARDTHLLKAQLTAPRLDLFGKVVQFGNRQRR